MASGPGARPDAGPTELDRIRSVVRAYFPVYETRIAPQSLLLAVHLDRSTLESKFDRMRQELWDQGYVPLLRRTGGEDFVEVVRRPPLRTRGTWINLVLLGATVATTVFTGALLWLTYVGGSTLTLADFLEGALYFGAPIMAILGLHELAHYWAARRRHLDASLPYFLPVPPPLPFGTFGAFVSIRGPFPDRKAQFDVAVAGPLVGFVVAIPISIGGMLLSAHAPVVPPAACAPTVVGLNYGSILFEPSFLWQLFGLFLPTSLIDLHPLALAGWVGLLVTSINLLPIGALDGGRVFRAVFGERARYASYAAAMGLFGLGIFYTGWLLFGLLVLFMGLRNPPPLNDLSPLDGKRYAIAACVVVVLVAGFAVVPIQTATGALDLSIGVPTHVAGPPGASLADVVNFTVLNHDPVGHRFVLELKVVSVNVSNGTGNSTLNGSALAAWAATSNWTFFLPGGVVVAEAPGRSAALSTTDSVPIPSGEGRSISVEYSSPQPAVRVVISVTAHEACAPPGAQSASGQFGLSS
jgi:membrane-associated protease RseP (regulator of RpoE activity)